MLRILITTALLASASAHALTLGPPREPSTPPRAPARGLQSHVALASSPAGVLAVWEDARTPEKPAIQVSRLDSSGRPLDDGGVSLAVDGGRLPAVAAGESFLVAWGSPALDHVFARRVTGAATPGEILDLGAAHDARPALASDGTSFLAAFASDANHLSFRLVPNSGPPAAASTIDAPGLDSGPALAFDGTGYLATWHGTGGIFAATIGPGGVAKPAFLVAANGTGAPGILRIGATTLVAWREPRAGGDHLWARLFRNATAYGDPFVVGTALAQAGAPIVLPDGPDFLIAWPEAGAGGSQDFYAAHADATAAVIDTAIPFLSGKNAREAAGAAIGGHTCVAFGASGDLFAAPLLPDATVDLTHAAALATTAAWREDLQLAFAPNHGVASWIERTDATGADVKAALVDATGTFGATIALDAADGDQDAARAALTASGAAVAWRDGHIAGKAQIRLARWASGATADPGGTVLTASDVTEVGAPSIAATGETVFVAWRENAPNRRAIVTSANGVPQTLALATSNEMLGEAHVAALADGALVVWTSTAGSQTKVQLQRLDSRGALLGAVRTVSTTTAIAGDLALAAGADEAVVAYAVAGSGVVAWPLAADGMPKTDVPWLAAGGTGNRRDARITFDGSSFVIAWREPGDAFVSRFTPAGEVRNAREPLSLQEWPVSLASPGNETTLLAYDVLDASPQFDSERIFTRSLAFPPRALAQTGSLGEDSFLRITLAGADLRSPESATFRIEVPPEHGALSGTPPAVTYTPAPDFSGEDTFSFVVDDAGQTSEPASVRLTVLPVNDAPRVHDQDVRVVVDGAALVTLDALDPDGDALTYRLLQSPGHGLLEGSAPAFKYTPTRGFCGVDRLVWVATDSQGAESEQATVTLEVWPAGGGPCAAQHPTDQGCSCGGAPAALALLGLLFRRRR